MFMQKAPSQNSLNYSVSKYQISYNEARQDGALGSPGLAGGVPDHGGGVGTG